MTENDKKELISQKTIKYLKITAFVFVGFSFLAPWLLTKYSIVDLTKTGEIGDTLGGIMNPFIALAGVAITFLAFYIQFKANQYQKEQFLEQLNIDKEQFKLELELQREQFNKNKFENQFYEMLSIHRENVSNLSTQGIKFGLDNIQLTERLSHEISGIKSLPYLLSEFELCLSLANKHFTKDNLKFRVNKAYHLFWQGIDEKSRGINQFCDLALTAKERLNNQIFLGHSNQLAHYYRQLFQTVKYIVYQSGYSYEEKRNFIRLLRSQLPNEEQVLLFYNWFSDYGIEWENGKNRFFTDYRMIHNLFPDMLASDEFDLKEIFKDSTNSLLTEANREIDSLFEFDDKM